LSGHHTLIRGNYQHNKVHPVRAGEHVLNKPLVSGNINKTNRATAEGQFGKTQIYGNATPFFFGQTVGVDTCQRPDQRRLAMVNVSSGANDY